MAVPMFSGEDVTKPRWSSQQKLSFELMTLEALQRRSKVVEIRDSLSMEMILSWSSAFTHKKKV
jgi:hypothetical protein